jgi:hypothetical protein
MEPDRGLEVLAVAISTPGDADRLYAGVEALRSDICHAVSEVRHEASFVAFQGLGRVNYRLQP